MSDMLSIGASGLRAYQSALSTVSENISNANTSGYTRKTTNLQEVANIGSISSAAGSGIGVVASGITRASSDYRSADVRQSSADLARTSGGVTWLQRIQSSLSDTQLSTQLTSFFSAAQSLAADPSSAAQRATMLSSATGVAAAFSAAGASLDQAMTELDASATAGVGQLNSLSAALGKINGGISRTAPGSGAAASLLDQRDSILEQMSALTDVSVQTDAVGRATVRVGGTNGAILVTGEEAGAVTYVRNSSGTSSFAIHRGGDTNVMNPTGGALAGIADGSTRLADARSQLNTFATNFTTGVNQVQAQGRDLNGNAGAAMFATGATPTDISLSLTDPSGIAAASSSGGTRDNSNLLALQALRTSSGIETKVSTMITANASDLAARQTVGDAQSSIRDTAVSARDANSGVNLDDEAVDLMRYQQAYQASSRVIQTAREIMQTIMNIGN